MTSFAGTPVPDELDDAESQVLSQINLIGAISKYLAKCGVGQITTRQMNAIITAANDIVKALETPDTIAAPGSGLRAWLASDDTGLSSCFMASVISGSFERPYAHPYDAADFGRCLRMLACCPDLRHDLNKMRNASKLWAIYIDNWTEMERLYNEELPTGACPKLCDLMQELQQQAT